MQLSTQKLTRLALLTAVALIIYRVELLIPSPVPIPGIKLGLSNIITLIVLSRFGRREALCVLHCRIFLSCFFFGHLLSLLYSLAGGLFALAVMALSDRFLEKKYLFLTSTAGGLAHNIAQLALAILLVRTPGLLSYLPYLTVSGLITGLFTGLCAHFTLKYLPKAV